MNLQAIFNTMAKHGFHYANVQSNDSGFFSFEWTKLPGGHGDSIEMTIDAKEGVIVRWFPDYGASMETKEISAWEDDSVELFIRRLLDQREKFERAKLQEGQS
jgi:hypothetical protein